MHVDTSFELSPKLNVYDPSETSAAQLPLDHFAHATHLSFYPEGIPTEALMGATGPLPFEPPFRASGESEVHLLDDGTPFAAYVKPAEPPPGWSEHGFVWIRARVDDLEVRCLREGEEVSRNECDPMPGDDRIVRGGSMDPGTWRTLKTILSTVRFLDGGGETGEAPGETTGPQAVTNPMVSVDRPEPGDTVSSPLEVTGEARGPWYFEGDFPVVLTDWDGRILAEAPASAENEWMTEDFVPFRATLTFESPYGPGDPDFMSRGTLILRKDNPSGRPELDAAVEIPVRFGPAGEPPTRKPKPRSPVPVPTSRPPGASP